MGMAMTVLSFAMLGRFTHVRQLTPSDLDPVKVWTAAEDRVVRWYSGREVLRQSEGGLRNPNAAEGMGRRATGTANGRATSRQPGRRNEMNPEAPPTIPPETPIVGYCRACGKALDSTSVHTAHGTIYCAEHVPAEPSHRTAGSDSPYTSPYTAYRDAASHSPPRRISGSGLRSRPDSGSRRDL